MISLRFIKPKYAKEDTELEVLWGAPDTRQMKTRTKVTRFPYNADWVMLEPRCRTTVQRNAQATG